MSRKSGLGRGLNVYFSDNSREDTGVTTVKITSIEPNRNQPRKTFDPEALADLSESIKVHGLLQPLLVKPMANGQYQIIAGERRWRAAKLAGISEVPVIIKDIDQKEIAEIALVENLQREDLNPIEEALGYKALMTEFELTQEEVSARVGKSRSAVANGLRLLNLPDDVLELIKEGKISAGHGRALLSLDGEHLDEGVKMALNGANVREIEALSKSKPKSPSKKAKTSFERKQIFNEIELSLKETLGRKVKIIEKNGKGTLTIEFFNEDDLIKLSKSFE